MRFFLVVLLSTVVLSGASASSAQAIVLGFADQKASMFSDPRFVALGTREARLNLPWDVLQDPNTLPGVDAWMAGARRRSISPLVTIDRSRREGMASRNPTSGEIATQVRKWRQRWPRQVQQISSWNEGNINKRPELVAQWYLAILRSCPGCTVLGTDIVDRGNAVSWAQRFIKAAKRTPAVWGFHNYVDSNNFKTTNTEAFVKAIPGQIWLTETGGVLKRLRPAVRFSGLGSSHAAAATSYLLKSIIAVDRLRIERVYIYSWSTGPRDLTWDSGMIGPDGTERPALKVVRCFIRRGCTSPKPPAYKPPLDSGQQQSTTPAG